MKNSIIPLFVTILLFIGCGKKAEESKPHADNSAAPAALAALQDYKQILVAYYDKDSVPPPPYKIRVKYIDKNDVAKDYDVLIAQTKTLYPVPDVKSLTKIELYNNNNVMLAYDNVAAPYTRKPMQMNPKYWIFYDQNSNVVIVMDDELIMLK